MELAYLVAGGKREGEGAVAVTVMSLWKRGERLALSEAKARMTGLAY